MCIDMKSFYASCSALRLGLDPLTACIAVVGEKNSSGSIVLAASPQLKKQWGIKTGHRRFEIPDTPSIHIVHPEMRMYLQVSLEITRMLYRYAPKKDIHVYSVDESFMRLNAAMSSMQMTARQVAERIQNDLLRQFGLPCSVGIGPNMLLSKLALDLEGKKTGIAHWTLEDVPTKLWPVQPLSEMWGIGRQLERRLNKMGIVSVGDLANFPLEELEKEFGVMGAQFYYHAHGIDHSEIGTHYRPKSESIGKSQVLMRDYYKREEILAVLLEICEEVSRRLRRGNKRARTISLGMGYSRDEGGGGFLRATTLDHSTNLGTTIYESCVTLFDQFREDFVVRKISVTLSNLESNEDVQMNLFAQDDEQKEVLAHTMDNLRSRFGYAALLRGVSYTKAGTAKERARLLGGHKA
ncbi:MAG: DNA polymerase thumb domain-containing protein [Bacilli bacterium]